MDEQTARMRQQQTVDRNMKMICDRTGASKAEQVMIMNFAKMLRRGFKDINIMVMHEGQEYRFEADWLVRMFLGTTDVQDPKQE